MKGLKKSGDWLSRKIARESEDGVAWVGWIDGHLNQKKLLRKLGVRGAMMWKLDESGGLFEQCICDTATMERLRKDYPLFWPGCFTGVLADGSQLDKDDKRYWKMS